MQEEDAQSKTIPMDGNNALDVALESKETGASPSKQARATVAQKDNVKVVVRCRPMNEKESK